MPYVRVTDAYSNTIQFASYRENFLDNGWFTVNQDKRTSMTVSTGIPTNFIDRWMIARYSSGSATFTWSEDGVTIVPNGVTCFLDQVFSRPLENGTEVTLSILMSDGTIYNRYTTVGSGLVNVLGTEIRTRFFTNYLRIQLSAAWEGGTIRAVKVDLGRPATLATDVMPNYALELLKCQRFYHIYGTSAARPSNAYDCVPHMDTGVTMTQGTVSIGGTTYYYNSARPTHS